MVQASASVRVLERCVVGFAFREEIGEQVEDLFLAQRVEQAGGHERERGGFARLDGGLGDLLHLGGGRAGLEGHAVLVLGEDETGEGVFVAEFERHVAIPLLDGLGGL